ncbi:peroxisomal N(1)-acetyl-spermine/spermidine oxidase-like isoform X2 [Dreissena polymorpha]|nr:peroxisomal N(1)-acetyl-spermine/spermidine oxidase-like isoform X2 [Dreissena polymorpha]
MLGDDGMPIEMGANWIHGCSLDNSVFAIADQIGAITPYRLINRASSRFMREDGSEIERETVLKAYYMYKTVEREMHDMMRQLKAESGKQQFIPLNHYRRLLEKERDLQKTDNNIEDIIRVHNALLNYVRFHEGNELEEVAWEGGSMWAIPEGGDVHLPYGYHQVLQYLVRKLPVNLVKLNSAVVKIAYGGNVRNKKVHVNTTNGEQYETDHVVITCSIGYLKKHCNSLFEPPLHMEKVRTINSMGMGRVNKIFLQFESPVTSPSFKNIVFAWNDTDVKQDKSAWFKRIFGFDQVFTKDNTILGWVAGEGAEYMEDLSDEEIGNTCVKILKQFMGRADLPRLKAIRVSRWCSNPYTLGSYSHQTARLTPGEQEDLARPVRCPLSKKPLLMFAGEALVNACTQGARDSGLRAASSIIQHYTTSKL